MTILWNSVSIVFWDTLLFSVLWKCKIRPSCGMLHSINDYVVGPNMLSLNYLIMGCCIRVSLFFFKGREYMLPELSPWGIEFSVDFEMKFKQTKDNTRPSRCVSLEVTNRHTLLIAHMFISRCNCRIGKSFEYQKYPGLLGTSTPFRKLNNTVCVDVMSFPLCAFCIYPLQAMSTFVLEYGEWRMCHKCLIVYYNIFAHAFWNISFDFAVDQSCPTL